MVTKNFEESMFKLKRYKYVNSYYYFITRETPNSPYTETVKVERCQIIAAPLDSSGIPPLSFVGNGTAKAQELEILQEMVKVEEVTVEQLMSEELLDMNNQFRKEDFDRKPEQLQNNPHDDYADAIQKSLLQGELSKIMTNKSLSDFETVTLQRPVNKEGGGYFLDATDSFKLKKDHTVGNKKRSLWDDKTT